MSEDKWYDVIFNHPVLSSLFLLAFLPLLPLSVVLVGFLFVGGLGYTLFGLASKKIGSGSLDGPSAAPAPDGPTKKKEVQEVSADARAQAQVSSGMLSDSNGGKTSTSDGQSSSGHNKASAQGLPQTARPASAVSEQVIEPGTTVTPPQRETSTTDSFAPVPPKALPVRGAAVAEPVLPQAESRGIAAQPILAAKSAEPAANHAVKPAKVEATGSAAILARLRQQRASSKGQGAAKSASGGEKEATIAYASQTGTAQEIARTIQAEAASHGVKARVMSCNELGFEDLAAAAAKGAAPVVVFVASSTGDGDSPDNAAKFFATLKRKTQPAGILNGVQFTVLGLGDSNYTRFCAVPRAISKRLLDLGGVSFYESKDADEVDGIEAVVDPWVAGLWGPLKQTLSPAAAVGTEATGVAAAAPAATASPGDGLVGVPPLPSCRVDLIWEQDSSRAASVMSQEAAQPSAEDLKCRDPEGMYSADEPFWATIEAARYLTAETSDRVVIHMELSVAGSGIHYVPGDSIGVLPCNDPALVDALLERLGQDGSRVFSVAALGSSTTPAAAGPRLLPHLKWPCTLRHALLVGCDLTSIPRKSLLRLLGEHCSDPAERRALLNLSSRGGREAYDADIKEARPTLLDLLRRFPSAQPPLAALLDALSPLMPRMYSITSSPLVYPDSVHVAFSVVRFTTPSGERQGVATSWLEKYARQLAAGEAPAGTAAPRVPVFLRRGGAFGLPSSLTSPMLMIGPGTGVAPFRGFLQHRRQKIQMGHEDAPGRAVLFFGCRRRDEDYLYGEELEGFAKDGTLSKLDVAFSRAQADKVYVQHLLAQQGKEFVDMLQDETAHVYVCGDGAAMAKAVHACLTGILEEHGGLSANEAAEKLAAMTKQGRYVRDIWS